MMPIVASQDDTIVHDATADAVLPTRVLFVAGLGRSGSTLLQGLLERCTGTIVVGELTHLWQRGLVEGQRCGCGVPVPDCPVWSQRLDQTLSSTQPARMANTIRRSQRRTERERYLPFLLSPVQPPGYRKHLHAYADLMAGIYRTLGQDGAVVVDTSKQPVSAALLRHIPGIEPRIVHLVRDPRAVAFSRQRRKPRPEVIGGGHMRRWSAHQTARRWLWTNLQVELLRTLPKLRVRYEQLAGDPMTTLAQIAAFAGIAVPDELNAQLASGAFEPHLTHSISGNPIRFATGLMPVIEDRRWHEQLAARDRRTVTWLTVPMRRRYYPNPSLPRTAALTTLVGELWPHATARPLRPGASTGAPSYAVLPNLRRPRVMLPLTNPAHTAAAIRSGSEGRGQLDRVIRHGIAALTRVSAVRRALPARVALEADPSGLHALSNPGQAEHAERLLAHCNHVLTEAGLAEYATDLSVRLGTDRSNRKPVLQLFSASGETIAFVKVGRDAASRTLVQDEAAALRAVGPNPAPNLQVPKVLATSRWHGLDLLVLSPLSGGRLFGGATRGRWHALVATIARLDGPGHWEPLGDSRFVVGLERTFTALPTTAAVACARTVLEQFVTRYGHLRARVGRFHGDLRPWNLAWGRTHVQLWDWERSRADVPLGLDALHINHPSPRPGEEAATHAVRVQAAHTAATSLVRSSGADPAHLFALGQLHALELVRRYLVDTDGTNDRADRWLATMQEF